MRFLLIHKSLFVLFLTIVMQFSLQGATKLVTIEKGILDLRGDNYKNLEEIDFTGEWEFYWNELIVPSDLNDSINISPTCILKVPSIWKNIEIDGNKLPAHGYGTYRIRILTDTTNLNFAIRVSSMSSASKVFVDSEMLFKGGQVGRTEQTSEPGYVTGVKLFNNKEKDFDILIQISNFHYSKGGLWNNVNSFGKAEYVIKAWENNHEVRLFMVGSILVIALYFLGLYLLNRRLKSSLFFALFCIDIALRSILVDEIYIMKLIPDFNWIWLIKLEYLTLPLGTIAFLFYFNDMLPYGRKWLFRVIVSINIFIVFILLFLNVNLFTQGLVFYQLAMAFAGVYSVYLVVKGLLRKDRIAWILFAVLIVLIATVLNDILYVNKLLNTSYLTTYGFMFFVFMQAYILSYRFLRMHRQEETLVANLEMVNANLEQTVVERTKEITKQHDTLLKKNSEIKIKRDSIKKQNKELKEQKEVITDSINYAQRIQEAILPSKRILAQNLKDYFIVYEPKDIVSGDFYWYSEKDGKLIVAAADCTGHGVPGAFMSMLGIAFLAEISKIPEVDNAAQILELLREKIKLSLRQYDANSLQKEGMDLALCIYDPSTKILEYSGAYNPLYLIRNKKLEIFRGDRQPASVHINEKPFTNTRIDVLEEDTFYIFSDGFQDQPGDEPRQKFKVRRFQNLLIELHEKPMIDQKEALITEFHNWKGNQPQIDDILIMGFKFY